MRLTMACLSEAFLKRIKIVSANCCGALLRPGGNRAVRAVSSRNRAVSTRNRAVGLRWTLTTRYLKGKKQNKTGCAVAQDCQRSGSGLNWYPDPTATNRLFVISVSVCLFVGFFLCLVVFASVWIFEG